MNTNLTNSGSGKASGSFARALATLAFGPLFGKKKDDDDDDDRNFPSPPPVSTRLFSGFSAPAAMAS